MSDNLLQLAQTLGKTLQSQHLSLTVAESCTGGWLGQVITSVPVSSEWFERGFVTYSNIAKQEMLSVSKITIEKYGSVSKEVALAMAKGALKHSNADIAVSITGIAGPDGGSLEKPVGLTWFGFAGKSFATEGISQHFTGDRQQIREQAVAYALEHLLKLLI